MEKEDPINSEEVDNDTYLYSDSEVSEINEIHGDDDFLYPEKDESYDKLRKKVYEVHFKLKEFEKEFTGLGKRMQKELYTQIHLDYIKYFNDNINNNDELLNTPLIIADLNTIDTIIATIESHKEMKKVSVPLKKSVPDLTDCDNGSNDTKNSDNSDESMPQLVDSDDDYVPQLVDSDDDYMPQLVDSDDDFDDIIHKIKEL